VLKAAEQTRRVAASALQAFMADAMRACGLAQADAAIVSAAMLEADFTGSDAHGVFRLPGYVRSLKRGQFNPRANIRVVKRGPATALVDGDNGMGHLVMTKAANVAVELARASGVGWVGSCRSNHAGAGAVYATIPLQHGMIGIYGAGSSVNHMAPWGSAEPLLGTNPIAVAIPARDEAPVVLDIATSIASNGAIRTHELEGKPLPEGWVIDRATGQPITDPTKLNAGFFAPMAGYKGSGLSLVLGLLAGPLNGASFGRDVRDFAAPPGAGPGSDASAGQFTIALDVARFVPLDTFTAEVDRHIRELSSSKRLPGVDEVRIPGQGRLARKIDRQANGVPLSETLIKNLDELATSLGIETLTARA
jgi:L-2-hydroxycarboxylate dehydrogenase (NAD+)